MPRSYRQRYALVKKHPQRIHKGTHPHDCHETSGGNGLIQKQNKVSIFENRTGGTINDILPDDETNEAFENLTGISQEWTGRRKQKYNIRRHICRN